jgi:hypothetical protein
MQERQFVLLDAHLAGMKAGLKLNEQQAKNWPAFESAVRGAAKVRSDRWTQARMKWTQWPVIPAELLAGDIPGGHRTALLLEWAHACEITAAREGRCKTNDRASRHARLEASLIPFGT